MQVLALPRETLLALKLIYLEDKVFIKPQEFFVNAV